jgi:DNA-binding response OmpR family regulator
MSGKDGREICKNLKHDPKTQKIPVIMISAHPSAAQTILECGAQDFLAKPFETELLLKRIKQNLNKNLLKK